MKINYGITVLIDAVKAGASSQKSDEAKSELTFEEKSALFEKYKIENFIASSRLERVNLKQKTEEQHDRTNNNST